MSLSGRHFFSLSFLFLLLCCSQPHQEEPKKSEPLAQKSPKAKSKTGWQLLLDDSSPKSNAPVEDIVIFIIIDALRRDHLGCYGYSRDTSPFLDRLTTQGLFIQNLVVHASQTVPSTSSLITGLIPSEHHIQFWSSTNSFTGKKEPGTPHLHDQFETMAEFFHQAGYHTTCLQTNPWLQGGYGFDQGFDDFYHIRGRLPDGSKLTGAHVNKVFKTLIHRREDKKLFFYLHYMDVHHPYRGEHVKPHFLPLEGNYAYCNGLRPDLSPQDLEYTKARYDEKILFADGLIGDLFTFLEDENLLEKTTIVLTSDHGDEFYEHQGLGHGTTLYNELINSFAIFWNPQKVPPRTVTKAVPAISLLPTLLDIKDMDHTSCEAPSLFRLTDEELPDTTQHQVIFSELAEKKALISVPWKLILDLKTGEEQFFFIGESCIIEDQPQMPDPDMAKKMRDRLYQLIAMAVENEGQQIDIDPETLEQLGALGYISL